MVIDTLRFGEIEVDSADIIQFPQGLPGFEGLRQFVLIKPEQDLPFSVLQSVEDGEIAFILTNPFIYYPNYEFQIPKAMQDELRIKKKEDVWIWSIVSVQGNLQEATINLLAPIVLNLRDKMGRQVILQGTEYRTKHKLFTEDNNAEAAAGSNPRRKESC